MGGSIVHHDQLLSSKTFWLKLLYEGEEAAEGWIEEGTGPAFLGNSESTLCPSDCTQQHTTKAQRGKPGSGIDPRTPGTNLLVYAPGYTLLYRVGNYDLTVLFVFIYVMDRTTQ